MRPAESHDIPLDPALPPLYARMAGHIGPRMNSQQDWQTPVPNLGFFSRDNPSAPCYCTVQPSVVLIVQGAKQIDVAGESYWYDPARFLITSLDLPASSRILQASPEQPCMGVLLRLDLRMLTEIITQGGLPPPRERNVGTSVGIGTATPMLVEPFTRLLALLDEPDAIPILSPLIQREIHYRLLLSDQASRLRQIASIEGQAYRILRAIDWLKEHFTQPLRIKELAEQVQMSAPSFHHHFRQLTAMSPLQYQKWLRLNEAKRLMLNEQLDAASAAFQVGYESPSQFSREYRRLFGAPPKRDVVGMRGVVA